MRIVSAAEAVASVRSGDQVYVHCAAATPSVLLDALVARAPELHDVGDGPPPRRRPRAASRARDGRPFPPPRAVHRAERPCGRQRGAGGLRAGLPVRRPAPVRFGRDPARRRPRQRHPTRRPWLLLAGHAASRRCTPRSALRRPSSSSSTARCRGPWARASSTSSDIDLAVEVDQPPYEHGTGTIGDVERRIGEHVAELVPDGATLQLGIGAIPAATAMALHGQARPRDPHRDVHRRGRRPGRGRAWSPGPARSATAARS